MTAGRWICCRKIPCLAFCRVVIAWIKWLFTTANMHNSSPKRAAAFTNKANGQFQWSIINLWLWWCECHYSSPLMDFSAVQLAANVIFEKWVSAHHGTVYLLSSQSCTANTQLLRLQCVSLDHNSKLIAWTQLFNLMLLWSLETSSVKVNEKHFDVE